ncbi:MAG: DMT family transporter [archaeon]
MWAALSVLAGFGDATVYAAMKKLQGIDPLVIVWVRFAFAIPFLVLSLFFYDHSWPARQFYPAMVLNALLIALGSYLMYWATQRSDLSKSIPLLNLTPLLLILTSYLMLGEEPAISGVFGIILIVIGAFAINISEAHHGILEPFRILLKNKGALCVAAVAVIYSVTASLSKIGILYSDPALFSLASYVFIAVLFLPSFANGVSRINFRKNLPLFIIMGTAGGVMMFTAAVAVKMALVSYVISLKRLSTFFSVLYGYFLFKESGIRGSLLGTCLMICGALLITV